jgi:hypothetical protein
VHGAADIAGVEAITFLVPEIEAPLELLAANFDWEPARVWSEGGATMAELAFDDPGSASVQLVAPGGDSTAARHLAEWGPGPYVRRLTCTDLDARERVLREHHVTVERGTALDGSGRAATLVYGAPFFASVLELVEPAA